VKKSAASVDSGCDFSRGIRRNVNIEWQLLEGVVALLVSVILAHRIFVAPSRAKRQLWQESRRKQDPRQR
jgi:hypothetical protein